MPESNQRPPQYKEVVGTRDHTVYAQPPTFQDQLQEGMRSAPWVLVSAVAHVILYLILMNFSFGTSAIAEEGFALNAEQMPADIPVLEEEPPLPEPVQPEKETEEVVDEPVVSDDEVDTVNVSVSDDNNPINESVGPFEGKGLNDVIGAGGGAGGGTGKYGKRRGAGKGGGSARQKSVDFGLEWLKNHQSPDGYWDTDDFQQMCKLNKCSGKGNPLNDIGNTGVALLAFLGAGNTLNTGKYKEVLKKGLRFLVESQTAEDGCFGPKGHQHFMYNHALACLSMVEGYYLSRAPHLKNSAQKGLEFIARSRNPYKAWRYAYPADGDNDVSVTGWMLFALFAGKDAGLNVDTAAIKDGMAFIDEMTDQGTWRTGYHEKGSPPARETDDLEKWPQDKSESMTAVAMLVRFFNHEDPETSAAMKGGATLLERCLPTWDEAAGTIDFYYWYYASYAMWQMSGKYWKAWEAKMLDSVVKNQRPDGDEKGSWDPEVDPWGDAGGRVYSTAINTLCLEVFYRYDKVFGAR